MLAFLAAVAVLTAGALLLGRLARALGQPAVLGEVAAGLLLSPGLLGPAVGLPAPEAATAQASTLAWLAHAGAALLLFQAGLGSPGSDLRRAGAAAGRVAAFGMAGSLAAGVLASLALAGLPGWTPADAPTWHTHLFVGAALTATSVGLTVRVLQDTGRLATREGHVILGAAVLDDVGGLVLLAAIAAVVASGTGAGPLLHGAALLGAFAVGLALSARPVAARVAGFVRRPAAGLAAVFFASVGLHVDASGLAGHAAALAIAVPMLVLAGVAGKLVSGLGLRPGDGDRLLVGIGMVPRGEVGLVFAALGASAGLLGDWPYAALLLAALATTLLAPPWLAWRARRLHGHL